MAGDNSITYNRLFKAPRETLRELALVLAMPPWEFDSKTGSPSVAWLALQKERVATLPAGVLMPKGLKKLEVKIADKSKILTPDKPTALCDAHRKLNPLLARDLFDYVSREFTVHANCIRTHRHTDTSPFPESVKQWCDRTLGATGLWMDRLLFRQIVGKSFPESLRKPCMHKLCEACIVAALMGSRDMIVDVRAGVLSRARLDAYLTAKREKRRAAKSGKSDKDIHVKVRRPQVWKLVEVWTEMLGEAEATVVQAESELLANELLHIRKESDRDQRKARRDYDKELGEGEGEGEGMNLHQYRVAKGHDPFPNPKTRYTKKGHPVPHGRKSEERDRSSVRMSDVSQSQSINHQSSRPESRKQEPIPAKVEEDYAPHHQEEDREPLLYTPPDEHQSGEYLPRSGLTPAELADQYLESLKDPAQRRAHCEDGFHDDEWYEDLVQYEQLALADLPPWPPKDAQKSDDNDVSDLSDDEDEDEDEDEADKLDAYEFASAVPAGLNLKKNNNNPDDDDDGASWVSATVFTYDPSGGRNTDRDSVQTPVPVVPLQYDNSLRVLPGQTFPPPSSVYSQDDPAPQTPTARRKGNDALRKLQPTAEINSSDGDGPPFRDPWAGRMKANQAYEASDISPGHPPQQGSSSPSSYLRIQLGVEAAFGLHDDGVESTILTPDDSASVVYDRRLAEPSVPRRKRTEKRTEKRRERASKDAESVVTRWSAMYR